MNNKLNLIQLQYLDAALKDISYFATGDKISLKLVIKDGSHLLAGDFMNYSASNYPQFKKLNGLGSTLNDLPQIPKEFLLKLLKPLESYMVGITKESCLVALENLDSFFQLIFRENIIKTLFETYPWDGLANIQPYLYNPIFIGESNERKLSFYALDSAKEYEVVSLIASDK